MDWKNLVAVCGLYCGACEMYRVKDDKNEQKLKSLARALSKRMGRSISVDDIRCDGCLGQGRLTPWCGKCQIRLCEKLQSGKERCSDCNDFPCARITDFSNDGAQHHCEVLGNLLQIKNLGIEAWGEHEKNKWACPECKAALSWYDAICPNCKAARPKQQFSIIGEDS